MRSTRYLLLILAIYFVFVGGSSRYVTLYQVRVFHHIIVTFVLSLWLIWRIYKQKGLPHTSLNTPLFALIGAWFLTSITSLDPRMAFEHIWFPITHVIIFFIIVDFFQRGRGKIIMEVFFFIAIIAVLLTILEYASWYLGLGILPNTQIGWVNVGILIPPFIPPASMAMGISTLVAGFTVPCIFITTTWALTVRNKAFRKILWSIGILLFVVLVLTFSRGGMLALIGGISIFILIRTVQNPVITSRISAKLLGGIGGIVTIGALLAFVITTLPFAIGRSDEGRLDMWQSAIEMTIDHPLTGVGPGLFGRAYREYRNPIVGRDKLASAHNLYLNITSELGIVGILVSGWLLVSLSNSIWQQWKSAKGKNQHIRIEGMTIALMALAIHSSVDVFTISPINLVFIIIVAYLVTGQRSILDTPPTGKNLPASILLILVVVYGVVLINWDRAQGLYQASFRKPPEEALQLTQQAQAIDPGLKLYYLHEAFIRGQLAYDVSSIQNAIQTYEEALLREPTWDIGWINLAYLEIQQNNLETALEYLQHAHDIYPYNTAIFAYARLADQNNLGDDTSIITAYHTALGFRPLSLPPYLPLSSAWWESSNATEATISYLDRLDDEIQYRVYRIYQPELAEQLIPSNPQTAVDYWIIGETYRETGDLTKAEEYFTQAIQLEPTNGDYYVSRAKTRLLNPTLAEHDLSVANLYGTSYEYPDAVRALLAQDEQEITNLKVNALPLRVTTQEFAGVLFTRPAIFGIPSPIQLPGLGNSVLQPWYDIAESFMKEGNKERAIQAYSFILEQAPYESIARGKLDELLESK